MVGCNLKILFSLNNVEYLHEKSPIKLRDSGKMLKLWLSTPILIEFPRS